MALFCFSNDATARSCFLYFKSVLGVNIQKSEVDSVKGRLRYPKGFSISASEKADAHIMFGFESEYGLNDIEKMLNVYGPSPQFGISKESWFQMSPNERLQWVKTNIKELFPEYRRPGKLIKYDSSPELGFLPSALIRDDTGNIELVLKPTDTLEDFELQVKLVHEHLGDRGSMQGSVSLPRLAYFGNNPNQTDIMF